MKRTAKSSAWKNYQHSSHTKQRIKIAILVLGLIVTLVFLGRINAIFKSLAAPIQGKEVVTILKKQYQWDGQSTINLVVRGKKVYALSYSPTAKEITILAIPDDTYLEVPLDFGSWPTRSVYGLGQTDQRTTGPQLLRQTLQLTLGVPMDGYLSLAGSLADQPFDQVVEKVRKNPIQTINLIRQSSTDLSLWELSRLLWQWWGIRNDQIKIVDLGQSQITQSILLSDSSRALGIDQTRLDQLIQNQFGDQRLNYEGLNVGIYNATDHSGLADRSSRIITNMGGRVVFTANSPQKLPKSLVLGKDSYTKTRLTQVFAPNCLVIKNCQSAVPNIDIDTTRADVILFIGEDDSVTIGS